MSMSDEEYESALAHFIPEIKDKMRARDTAQREALARVEAERDAMEAMVGMLEEKEWAEHASKGPVSSRLETCITTLMNELSEANERADEAAVSGMAYAEQRDTAQAQLAEVVGLLRKIDSEVWPEWDRHGSQAAALVNVKAFLADYAQAEQQESQGAQDGYDERQTALREMFQITYAGDIWEILGRLYDAGYRRAALATQPAATPVAAGEPVAYEFIHRHIPGAEWERCSKDRFELYQAYHWEHGGVPPVRALYAAPPAAAHGDEAVRKDAERYRLLRRKVAIAGTERKAEFCILNLEPVHIAPNPSIELDAAIDAAMRAQGDGGGS